MGQCQRYKEYEISPTATSIFRDKILRFTQLSLDESSINDATAGRRAVTPGN
jgi:hypothetical protein